MVICFILQITACMSSNINGGFNAVCAKTRYYCDVNSQCRQRTERCTGATTCINPVTRTEANCNCQGRRCSITMGSYSLLSSSGKRLSVRPYHDFINYKGFTWEYGNYGLRVLDITDPKYARQRAELGKATLKTIGSSSCTYEKALSFVQLTGGRFSADRYKLFTNNCQDFAASFQRWLKSDCTKLRKKRTTNETADLTDYFMNLIDEGCPGNMYKMIKIVVLS